MKKLKIKIKLTSLIQPHFFTFWRSKRPYSVLLGGRGSFKSSTTAIKLVYKMKQQIQGNHKANVIVVRENATNLRDSVYNQICWAINKLQMTNEFMYHVSPMTITHKRTGSTFYFYGADKPERLKSNTVQDIIAVWYEEAANFKGPEVFDQSNPTFIRQKSQWVDIVEVIWTYNPPKNPYDWINEWVQTLQSDKDYLVDKSTYHDDVLGFTTQQQLNLIEKYKRNDYDYYRYLYEGEPVGLGTNVYNMGLFHPLKELPNDDELVNIYFSVDSGHETSATTEGCYGITTKGNCILLDTYYYSPAKKANKKAPSDLAEDLHAFEQHNIERWDMDQYKRSADSATADYALDNEYYKRFGVKWHHVAKTTKVAMIDHVQDLLAQGRFFYLDSTANEIFIAEHRRYQWDEDTMEADPKVIKEHDHTCDQFQYFVLDNKRDLELKW
jgi:phage terminase large subunit